MLHSLAAQVDYFQNLIRQHPGWEFCGVFADEAKTGTKDERPEYQKMLEKCRNRDLQIKVKPQFSEFTNNSQDKKWHDKKAASNLKKEAA